MNKGLTLFFCGILCTTLVGCESLGKKDGRGGSAADAANASSVDQAALDAAALAAKQIPAQKVIYFDYDRSDIKPASRDTVTAHANYLKAHPNARVTLEGHADERGSREYNVGLGERRAKAVEQSLTLQGANASQLNIVSYGEERPASPEHDESAWSLNRRVEFVYP